MSLIPCTPVVAQLPNQLGASATGKAADSIDGIAKLPVGI